MSQTLNSVWRDITLNVTREMIEFVEKFTAACHTRSYLKIYVDEMTFGIRINKNNVVKFLYDGGDISKDGFLEQLDTYMYSAKLVCYRVTKQQKFSDPPTQGIVKNIETLLNDLEEDERLNVEVCKTQTFMAMEIERMSYPKFQGFSVYNSMINIIDVYEDHGVVNNDLLNRVLQERPPIFEDMFKTVSTKKIAGEFRRILRTTEPLTRYSVVTIRTVDRCVMNLDTPHEFGMIAGQHFKMTPDAIEDRCRYKRVEEYKFLEELVEVAWEPCRYREWCLDHEERTRIESYRQNKVFNI
jgi:hypothetical protein